MKSYYINEIFASPQGEGGRAGEQSIFIRFTGCNLRCDIEPGERSPGGFACDTEFESGRALPLADILGECDLLCFGDAGWLVLTGGEPALQVDEAFVDFFRKNGYRVAIETNGTVNIDALGLDWICVSPKVAEHAIKQLTANEVKYVRGYGQGIPRTRVQADLKYISPVFSNRKVDPRALAWCLDLVAKNPEWRLSTQQHHGWGVR